MKRKVIEHIPGSLGKRNAAFVGFHFKSEAWRGFESLPVEARNKEILQVALNLRWDSRFGFPGGLVEEGESLKHGAVREVREELNFSIDESKLELLCTHQVKDDLNAHFFTYEITEEEKRLMYKNLLDAPHFGFEISGLVFLQCVNHESGKGVDSFLENTSLAPAVDIEIKKLMEKYA